MNIPSMRIMTMDYRSGASDVPRSPILTIAHYAASALAAALAIGLTEFLADWSSEPMSRIPFVTSIVLVTSLPHSTPARPKSVFGGHLVSALAGLASLWLLGTGEFAAAFAVGLALVGMQLLRVLHPPAGINAFLIPTLALPWTWVLTPVVAGSLILAAYSWVWSRLSGLLAGQRI